MANNRYRIRCTDCAAYIEVEEASEPAACPVDVGHTIDPVATVILARGVNAWALKQAVRMGTGVQSMVGGVWVELDCVISDPVALTPDASERMGQVRCQVRSDGDVNSRLLEDGVAVGSATVTDTAGAWTEAIYYTSAPSSGSHVYALEFDAGAATQADVRGCSLAILER